jgi:hypothetical protein
VSFVVNPSTQYCLSYYVSRGWMYRLATRQLFTHQILAMASRRSSRLSAVAAADSVNTVAPIASTDGPAKPAGRKRKASVVEKPEKPEKPQKTLKKEQVPDDGFAVPATPKKKTAKNLPPPSTPTPSAAKELGLPSHANGLKNPPLL